MNQVVIYRTNGTQTTVHNASRWQVKRGVLYVYYVSDGGRVVRAFPLGSVESWRVSEVPPL